MTSTVLDILRSTFGHASLYPLQQRIIDHVLPGGHALVVMPTGSGKSLCYQLPALALDAPGVTLVFSPLIALMEDQVAALKARRIRAEYINSTLSRRQRVARYEKLGQGAYDLIYATPERMHKPDFRAALEQVPGGVKLLAIDEAHCITKWGHDFRPAYQQVGEFRHQLGDPPTIALTATATPPVRRDIRRTLGLDADRMPLFAADIDRPNLRYATQEVWADDDKLDAICDIAEAARGTTIVYFALIKTLEEFAGQLRSRLSPQRIAIYHGQLPARIKREVYRRFTSATPDEQLLLLATNAFGMGVDKSDIRAIIHAQIPGSVEAYFQEVGRAGRDGRPAACELLYQQADLAIQQQFIDWMNPSADLLMQAATAIERSGHSDFDVDELREVIIHKNRGDRRAEYCMITLEKLGVIEPTGIDERYRLVRPLNDEEVDPAEIDAKKKRDLTRLLDMVKLTRADDMRRFILEYFSLDDAA